MTKPPVPMNQITKIGGQTITCFFTCNEFHVTMKDEHGTTVYFKHYKDHEVVDALAKYDDLVLAARIEHTIKHRRHKQK